MNAPNQIQEGTKYKNFLIPFTITPRGAHNQAATSSNLQNLKNERTIYDWALDPLQHIYDHRLVRTFKI